MIGQVRSPEINVNCIWPCGSPAMMILMSRLGDARILAKSIVFITYLVCHYKHVSETCRHVLIFISILVPHQHHIYPSLRGKNTYCRTIFIIYPTTPRHIIPRHLPTTHTGTHTSAVPSHSQPRASICAAVNTQTIKGKACD